MSPTDEEGKRDHEQYPNPGGNHAQRPRDRDDARRRCATPTGLRCVYQAELVKRWLLGPPGWSLVVCEIDRKVGGAYRYVWPGADGTEFGMRGGYREVASPERLVNTESFDKPWHPGDALVTTVLVGQGGRTVLTTTLLYASREGQGIGRPGRERAMRRP